jgi:parvulin-like peptidyl-prolyl isomerase
MSDITTMQVLALCTNSKGQLAVLVNDTELILPNGRGRAFAALSHAWEEIEDSTPEQWGSVHPLCVDAATKRCTVLDESEERAADREQLKREEAAAREADKEARKQRRREYWNSPAGKADLRRRQAKHRRSMRTFKSLMDAIFTE